MFNYDELSKKLAKFNSIDKIDQKIINLADSLKTVKDVEIIIYNYNIFTQFCILRVLLWKNKIDKFEESDFFFKWMQNHQGYLL